MVQKSLQRRREKTQLRCCLYLALAGDDEVEHRGLCSFPSGERAHWIISRTLGHVPRKSIKLHKVCARACVWRMNEKKKREREISSNKEKKKKTD